MQLINMYSFPFGPRQAKMCLRTGAKFADSDHLSHALSIIRAFAFKSYTLFYPMILLGNTKGPDQTADS